MEFLKFTPGQDLSEFIELLEKMGKAKSWTVVQELAYLQLALPSELERRTSKVLESEKIQNLQYKFLQNINLQQLNFIKACSQN